jgi:hypothetical protein
MSTQTSRILAHLRLLRESTPRHFWSAAVVGLSLSGMVTAFAQLKAYQHTVAEPLLLPPIEPPGKWITATGPHLHYEFRINNVHQNPLSAALPADAPLTTGQLAQFKRRADPLLAQLATVRYNHLALLDQARIAS